MIRNIILQTNIEFTSGKILLFQSNYTKEDIEANIKPYQDMEKDMENKIDEISRIRNLEDNPFDKSVVNALANSNIDTSIRVNKKLTS